ncbi:MULTISPECIES: metal-dependent transcriptional regulator [Bacteroidota]|uniref:Transcriptional regulator MntR n=3 Tax=Sphingobacterium TaxID=28453 RepID=A0A1X7J7J9_9SPHI|nr:MULTISPECIES: metal-dependent transcriptional regulator [Bacteroidota]MDV3779358.1 metal-dependent transcriptional regulator [Elizabethkingia anophelis]KFF20014.1 iron (metal) dependent repressor, dtxr family protein [Chryseobacterium sp. JM1]MDV3792836.1 metal-dependent transcriptional regulator [Elizabethkingia anophelis]MDV3812597.1 metal-dependent transcriptional regulator [Elizabethkingia anophelis]MDV3822389.1 metal-dependent transcriptional regulator [Elizabethkingia anophelis]
MISHTEENYLKVLYNLTSLKGEASVNDISKQLDIKMPTVNSMMKRLAEKELVVYESYKPLKLTDEGKKLAALIIRKHRLTEMYLVEKMGFGWEQVHNIAEQIEHIQAPEFFEKMDELLGFPKVDPHGSPIPDAEGNIASDSYVKLSDCKVGDTVTFMAVQPSSEDLLKFLTSRELSLGLELKIKQIEPFDGSMAISYGSKENEMLSSKVCDKLLVSKKRKKK